MVNVGLYEAPVATTFPPAAASYQLYNEAPVAVKVTVSASQAVAAFGTTAVETSGVIATGVEVPELPLHVTMH